MALTIPTSRMVRDRLERLAAKEVKQLAKDTGVPFGTLMKIRMGETTNPGIETVGKFFHLIDLSRDKAADKAGDQ